MLVDEELELEPVGVVSAPPGLDWLPAHWNLPLMTLLLPERDLKCVQTSSMLLSDWMLKAPRTSLRLSRETLKIS